MKKLQLQLKVWDKTLIKYYLVWKWNQFLGIPEYEWIWYKRAFHVRKEDREDLINSKKI